MSHVHASLGLILFQLGLKLGLTETSSFSVSTRRDFHISREVSGHQETWFFRDSGRSLADSSAFFPVCIIQYLHQSRDSAHE